MFTRGYFAAGYFTPYYFPGGVRVSRLYAHRPVLRRTVGIFNTTETLVDLFAADVRAEEEEVFIAAIMEMFLHE